MAMLHRSTAIIICDGAYPPRPAAGICCRSFSYAYFLSGTSLLLCLTHISRFALAQRNGVEPQRNALKGAATGAVRSRPPLPRTRSPNITADCVKLTLPGRLTNRLQINLTHQFVPLGLTPKWERRAGPPSSCGGFKSAFLWRLDTVSLGKHQRNGVERQGKVTTTSQGNGAHVQGKENKRGNHRRGFPLGPPPALQ